MPRGQTFFWGIFGILVVALIAWVALTPKPAAKTLTIGSVLADPSQLPGLLTTQAPWGANLDTLGPRLDSMDFPRLSAEGTVLHIHQHLDIFVHGKPVAVPADIGVAPGFISPIHVHDTSGIIHVESPVEKTFYLGEMFDVWGLRFTKDAIGGYVADAKNSLRVYVNGKLVDGDPRQIELLKYAEIAVVYGTASEIPATIPSSYTFPSGY